MNVKLFVILIYLTVADSQSTISSRNLQLNDEFLQHVKYEIESTLQLWLTQQQAADCSECQAIKDMKSQVEEIREIVIKQKHRNETIAIEQMKLEVEKIREIVLKQQNRPRNACPPGFDYLPEVGSCFKVIFEKMTWDNATERCRQVMPGVHLAAITSQAENDAVARYLQSQFRGNNNCMVRAWGKDRNLIWIGGQTRNPRLCRDPYVWKPLRGIEIPFNYTNWSGVNPDCYGGVESCVQVIVEGNGLWNDLPCDLLICAICELHV